MAAASKKVVDLSKERELRDRREYGKLVLAVFDQIDHEEKRDQKEKASEVRREARNKL